MEFFWTQRQPTEVELQGGFWREEGEPDEDDARSVEQVKVREVKSEEKFWEGVEFEVKKEHAEGFRCVKRMMGECGR